MLDVKMVKKRKAAKRAPVMFRTIALPLDVRAWLEKEARRNGASQSSEIIRSVRNRMDAERRERERAGR
jgi:hypothetical protein